MLSCMPFGMQRTPCQPYGARVLISTQSTSNGAYLSTLPLGLMSQIRFSFSRMRSEGFSFNSGGLGVESCSRPVASMFATVRNRSQPFATVRSRSLRRCHWGKLLQVTMHGCVTCQFAPLFHCDLHENGMWRKTRDAFRCTGAAFCEIRSLLRSSIGISVWRVVFLGCWMWPCHWDLRFRMWHRGSVFVTSLS